MIENPVISIIISTSNNALYLNRAIDSVLHQTFKNWELIIINDASTDNTDTIVKKFMKVDSRILYLKNKKNLGTTVNANKGIDIARGEFIARLDGDDYWTDETKLQQQTDYLQKNLNCSIVGSLALAVDSSENELFEIKYPSEDKDIRRIMLKHGPFVHSSVLIRKKILLKIGKYNTKHHYSQDYDLYLNLGTVSEFHNIPKFMVNYRINPLGISRTKYLEQHKEIVKIIKKYKREYQGYFLGALLWNLRKIYPVWFRGSLSREIKKNIFVLGQLSGI